MTRRLVRDEDNEWERGPAHCALLYEGRVARDDLRTVGGSRPQGLAAVSAGQIGIIAVEAPGNSSCRGVSAGRREHNDHFSAPRASAVICERRVDADSVGARVGLG